MTIIENDKETLGKCAWITGASSGIGLSIAQTLYNRVNSLALSSRNETKLIELSRQISKNSDNIRNIFPIKFDVRHRESIVEARNRIAAMYKSKLGEFDVNIPDILINNAGACYFAKTWEYTDEQITEMLDANLAGIINCSRNVLPGMMSAGRGVILNILSVASVKAFSNCSVYAATKAGALAFSRSLREEVREYNIKIIDIMAGATETQIWADADREKFSARMLQPNDIAETVLAALELANRDRVAPEEILVRPRLGDI